MVVASERRETHLPHKKQHISFDLRNGLSTLRWRRFQTLSRRSWSDFIRSEVNRVLVSRLFLPLLIICIVFPSLLVQQRGVSAGARVDFQRVVRPILSDACFHCHGPTRRHIWRICGWIPGRGLRGTGCRESDCSWESIRKSPDSTSDGGGCGAADAG